jgi:sulfoxide reductase heme-binding subunit YedZ
VDFLGTCAIRAILVVLAVSPIARLLNWPQLVQVRRLLGLWASFYVLVHFSAYFVFLSELSVDDLVLDFVKRPYITVGILAMSLMLPLVVTSTRKWQLRLGSKWKNIHKLVYLSAIAAWLHLLWVGKGSIFEAFIYGMILVLLFGERVKNARRKKRIG